MCVSSAFARLGKIICDKQNERYKSYIIIIIIIVIIIILIIIIVIIIVITSQKRNIGTTGSVLRPVQPGKGQRWKSSMRW